MADEDELFAEAMGRVRPLAASNKIDSESLKKRKKEQLSRRVRVGTIEPPQRAFSPEVTDGPWQLIADGVSRERVRRLGAGRPPVGPTFDLHGMRRDEALELLVEGFNAALLDGQRALRIIHGRGLHSQGKAILKEAVYHWLREGAFAHAVLAAIPEPGSGGGACLVLLRRQGT
ncbi:DNA-nicking endonuclease, Smr domain [Mariprofundus aestuarium]|uniref:DNA-nicking endonuclease, Smr domain n=1 Tax=Mariprofundus aestuarium TaxID=1921086 RepID=A0A2K8L335_MARES|nr:Smr/MutS family protein [Mariprofundus aestuarium]ATX78656.1 DNA-nicking endonuclease, Smr domain [Mariprofundus aestuarium]